MVYEIQGKRAYNTVDDKLTLRGDHPFIYFEGCFHRGTQYIFITLKDIWLDGERVLDKTGKVAVSSVFPAIFSDGTTTSVNVAKDNFHNAVGTGVSNLFEVVLARESMAYRSELQIYDGKNLSWDNLNNFLGSIYQTVPFIKVATKIGENVFLTRITPVGEWKDGAGNELTRSEEHVAALPITTFTENIRGMEERGIDMEQINDVIKSLLVTHVSNQIYSLRPEQKVVKHDPDKILSTIQEKVESNPLTKALDKLK